MGPPARLKKSVGFAAQRRQIAAEASQARARRKQQLTEITIAGDNAFTTRLQRLVVEREHGPVGVSRQPRELIGDCPISKRPLMLIK